MRIYGVAAFLAIAACDVADAPAVPDGDGQFLQVDLVQDYYWPASVPTNPEVVVFPIVTALVVSRADGVLLVAEDEAASRTAAQEYCAEHGKAFSAESDGRLSDGTWAFPDCFPAA